MFLARGEVERLCQGQTGANMTKSNAVQNGDANEAALDPKALEAIGRALKAHYDDLVEAPLPDKFVELLARLEERERLSQTSGKRDASE
jgi:hypothetical protein